MSRCVNDGFILLVDIYKSHRQNVSEDSKLIRKADVENHNRDGGLWIVWNKKIYDFHNIRFVVVLMKLQRFY